MAAPNVVSDVWVTADEIDADEVVSRVGSDRDGAVVVFHGITRDHNEGRSVLWLEYEAYSPMAEDMMTQIIDEMRERWQIGDVAVCHRTGRVDIGQTSMVLAVSAAHRRPAFESALYFIDRLKEVVPIWKKEYFEVAERSGSVRALAELGSDWKWLDSVCLMRGVIVILKDLVKVYG